MHYAAVYGNLEMAVFLEANKYLTTNVNAFNFSSLSGGVAQMVRAVVS